MKILGLIPARGGSKGVPGKNQKKLVGKPLICYTIAAALASNALEKLIVSTDDESIAQLSKNAGAEVPFLRPKALATDNSPTIDTVIHALRFYEDQNIYFDGICLLQPTCPLRNPQDIFQAIKIFKKKKADSLISVREVPHQYNPHWTFEQKEDSLYLKIATGEKQIIPRRQALPKAYHRDGSIYITRTTVLKALNSLYGEKISWYQSPNPHYVNIDTIDDWEVAEKLIKKIKLKA